MRLGVIFVCIKDFGDIHSIVDFRVGVNPVRTDAHACAHALSSKGEILFTL